MTTLPPNYLRLSSKWLKTNPLPADGMANSKWNPEPEWNDSGLRGTILSRDVLDSFEYATARTDLPPEAYEATTDSVVIGSKSVASEASERAEENANKLPPGYVRIFCEECGWSDGVLECIAKDEFEGFCDHCVGERTFHLVSPLATLRAQLEAKEAECQQMRESNAVIQSQLDNADVNLEQVRLAQKGIWRTKVESAELRITELESENDKLRAEVEQFKRRVNGELEGEG